jgi:DinB family protein
MNGKDAIKTALRGTAHLLNMYLSDLSDADLLVRPCPNANHIAWQLGHLISAEDSLIGKHIPGAAFPALPAGFKEKHAKEAASNDAPAAFLKKAEYLNLFNNLRELSITAVEKLSDADLDRPNTGNMAKMAPTLGALLLLQSNHTMMHVGQFSAVRRKLGKPVLI